MRTRKLKDVSPTTATLFDGMWIKESEQNPLKNSRNSIVHFLRYYRMEKNTFEQWYSTQCIKRNLLSAVGDWHCVRPDRDIGCVVVCNVAWVVEGVDCSTNI